MCIERRDKEEPAIKIESDEFRDTKHTHTASHRPIGIFSNKMQLEHCSFRLFCYVHVYLSEPNEHIRILFRSRRCARYEMSNANAQQHT